MSTKTHSGIKKGRCIDSHEEEDETTKSTTG